MVCIRRTPLRALALVGLASGARGYHIPQATKETKEKWYSRYPAYPDYCSTPNQMRNRIIPQLPDLHGSSRMPETRIVHVTSVFRHGARTINVHTQEDKEDKHACWPGYWEDEEQSVWDCDLTTLLAPPTPMHVKEEEGNRNNGSPSEATAMLLFDKRYDALGKYSPENTRVNLLNGTCQASQLLLQGYEQEITNGQTLREAYFHKGDARMRLFERLDDDSMKPWDEHNLYLRSDDYQRTVMSGQLVLRGLFGPELALEKSHPTIPVHVADLDRDIIGGHESQCPRLVEMKKGALSSPEYKSFLKSTESVEVQKYLKENLSEGKSIVDCLMTSICTDRTLPDGVYNPNPGNWLHRISNYRTKRDTFHLRYNDGEYAKLQLSVLWAEIMEHILPVVDTDEEDRRRPPARLALYASHDGTINSILPTLGPRVGNDKPWPPYASMFLIEIHEFVDSFVNKTMYPSKFGFRLIYNGRILTSQMDDCPDKADLCDIQILIDRVRPFAKRSLDCSPTSEPRNDHQSSSIRSKSKSRTKHSTMEGVLLVLGIMTISSLLGSMAVFMILTGRSPAESGESMANLSELDNDREGRVGLMRTDDNGDADEIELTSSNNASIPFDEGEDSDFMQ